MIDSIKPCAFISSVLSSRVNRCMRSEERQRILYFLVSEPALYLFSPIYVTLKYYKLCFLK